MDSREHYELTKSAFEDALAGVKQPPLMMSIEPFEAEDDMGEPIRIVGVYDDDSDMRFISICEGEDGEIYPVAIRSAFKKGTSAGAPKT
jgi:hypothetical protein